MDLTTLGCICFENNFCLQAVALALGFRLSIYYFGATISL